MSLKRKKCEFESPWSESLGFKCGTPIMLKPLYTEVTYKNWRLVRFPITWHNWPWRSSPMSSLQDLDVSHLACVFQS
jgi:hypothetical protein